MSHHYQLSPRDTEFLGRCFTAVLSWPLRTESLMANPSNAAWGNRFWTGDVADGISVPFCFCLWVNPCWPWPVNLYSHPPPWGRPSTEQAVSGTLLIPPPSLWGHNTTLSTWVITGSTACLAVMENTSKKPSQTKTSSVQSQTTPLTHPNQASKALSGVCWLLASETAKERLCSYFQGLHPAFPPSHTPPRNTEGILVPGLRSAGHPPPLC